jgi:hypothetical protein
MDFAQARFHTPWVKNGRRASCSARQVLPDHRTLRPAAAISGDAIDGHDPNLRAPGRSEPNEVL